MTDVCLTIEILVVVKVTVNVNCPCLYCEDILYRVSRGVAPSILNHSTRWGEWSALCPSQFIPRQGLAGTHQIGGWMSRRAGLGILVGRNVLPLLVIEP
jgi:hypothetical protein